MAVMEGDLGESRTMKGGELLVFCCWHSYFMAGEGCVCFVGFCRGSQV